MSGQGLLHNLQKLNYKGKYHILIIRMADGGALRMARIACHSFHADCAADGRSALGPLVISPFAISSGNLPHIRSWAESERGEREEMSGVELRMRNVVFDRVCSVKVHQDR